MIYIGSAAPMKKALSCTRELTHQSTHLLDLLPHTLVFHANGISPPLDIFDMDLRKICLLITAIVLFALGQVGSSETTPTVHDVQTALLSGVTRVVLDIDTNFLDTACPEIAGYHRSVETFQATYLADNFLAYSGLVCDDSISSALTLLEAHVDNVLGLHPPSRSFNCDSLWMCETHGAVFADPQNIPLTNKTLALRDGVDCINQYTLAMLYTTVYLVRLSFVVAQLKDSLSFTNTDTPEAHNQTWLSWFPFALHGISNTRTSDFRYSVDELRTHEPWSNLPTTMSHDLAHLQAALVQIGDAFLDVAETHAAQPKVVNEYITLSAALFRSLGDLWSTRLHLAAIQPLARFEKLAQ